jgi:hypothetical protein
MHLRSELIWRSEKIGGYTPNISKRTLLSSSRQRGSALMIIALEFNYENDRGYGHSNTDTTGMRNCEKQKQKVSCYSYSSRGGFRWLASSWSKQLYESKSDAVRFCRPSVGPHLMCY